MLSLFVAEVFYVIKSKLCMTSAGDVNVVVVVVVINS